MIIGAALIPGCDGSILSEHFSVWMSLNINDSSVSSSAEGTSASPSIEKGHFHTKQPSFPSSDSSLCVQHYCENIKCCLSINPLWYRWIMEDFDRLFIYFWPDYQKLELDLKGSAAWLMVAVTFLAVFPALNM